MLACVLTDLPIWVRASRKGGLLRVVFGLQTLLDPANEVVDPNLPHLELHPKIVAALAAAQTTGGAT